MRIVFIGPPGAGKGTQCRRLSGLLGLPHLSTGEMLRATQKEPSALGRQIARLLAAGQLAPDYLVLRILRKRLRAADAAGGYLLDGFPRTVNQAVQLDEYLAERGEKIDLVLNLVADEEVIIARMLKRAALEDREDDNESTIAARIRVFHRQTAPVLQYYRDRGVVQDVDATGAPDEVFQLIVEKVRASAAAR